MDRIQLDDAACRKWNTSFNSRQVFTNALAEIAGRDERIVYIAADLGRAFKWRVFADRYPDRAFNTGIAEQDAVGFAAGLATAGFVPFFITFAPFATMRPCEQIKADAAYTGLPVRIVGTDAGLACALLGNTHLGVEDMGVMCAIPDMTVIAPADGAEIYKAAEALADYPGPAYIRLDGGDLPQTVHEHDYSFEIGRAELLRDGADVTIAACGGMVGRALAAAGLLEKRGVSARVLNMHTVKPLDTAAIADAIARTGLIVSVEEHTVHGGLGSQIADVIAARGEGRLVKLGLPDAFPRLIYTRDRCLHDLGLDPDGIAAAVAGQLI